MNAIHPTIKFEISHSRDRIPFLDTTVILTTNGNIETTLYKKPTDVSPLLHAQSFHPINCKSGIIYSQALRYRRIISNNDEFEKHLEVLQFSLIKRGYKIGLINKIFDQVRLLSRDNLLQYQDRPPTNILPFIIPFNWNTLHIGRILHLHWHLIQDDDNLQDISSLKPIMAFKRQRNIRDMLVHSDFDHGSTWPVSDVIIAIIITYNYYYHFKLYGTVGRHQLHTPILFYSSLGTIAPYLGCWGARDHIAYYH